MKKADGLDEAILGTATRPDLPEILVYDYYKCVDIFMENNEWTEEEALEWMDFNVEKPLQRRRRGPVSGLDSIRDRTYLISELSTHWRFI